MRVKTPGSNPRGFSFFRKWKWECERKRKEGLEVFLGQHGHDGPAQVIVPQGKRHVDMLDHLLGGLAASQPQPQADGVVQVLGAEGVGGGEGVARVEVGGEGGYHGQPFELREQALFGGSEETGLAGVVVAGIADEAVKLA